MIFVQFSMSMYLHIFHVSVYYVQFFISVHASTKTSPLYMIYRLCCSYFLPYILQFVMHHVDIASTPNKRVQIYCTVVQKKCTVSLSCIFPPPPTPPLLSSKHPNSYFSHDFAYGCIASLPPLTGRPSKAANPFFCASASLSPSESQSFRSK